MQKRQTTVLASMVLLLMIGLFLSPSPAAAFTKVTDTPDESEPTSDIDIPALLEDVIEQLDAEEYTAAIDTLNTIIAADETIWDAYYFRAFANANLGDTDLAIDDYTRALTLRPYDPGTYTLRGSLYIQVGDLEQADLDYDQAIYLNPRYLEAYIGKAILNSRLNDETLAQIYEGIFNGMQAGANGDIDETIDILTETIDAVNGNNAPSELGYVYYNRANTYIGMDEWDKALDDMNNAIELQPWMQDYYMARGFIYSETNQLALAAPDFYERMTLIELTSIDNTIDFGESVPVEMDYGVIARLTFTADAGQTVTITARDSVGDGVDPLLVLLDADGTPIVGNDDGGGELDSLINDFELPASGTYTVVVSHANGGFFGTVNVSLK